MQNTSQTGYSSSLEQFPLSELCCRLWSWSQVESSVIKHIILFTVGVCGLSLWVLWGRPLVAAVLTASQLLFEKWSTLGIGGHLHRQLILIVPDVCPRIWNKCAHSKKKKKIETRKTHDTIELWDSQLGECFLNITFSYSGFDEVFMELSLCFPCSVSISAQIKKMTSWPVSFFFIKSHKRRGYVTLTLGKQHFHNVGITLPGSSVQSGVPEFILKHKTLSGMNTSLSKTYSFLEWPLVPRVEASAFVKFLHWFIQLFLLPCKRQ